MKKNPKIKYAVIAVAILLAAGSGAYILKINKRERQEKDNQAKLDAVPTNPYI